MLSDKLPGCIGQFKLNLNYWQQDEELRKAGIKGALIGGAHFAN